MRILLIGPTAVGKTACSFSLAESLPAEIISADSRQCYQYVDIGTAKPTEQELKQVKHYNISIFPPDHPDSAADFRKRAMNWEQEIANKQKHVLYVGGSTLHLQVILQPLDDLPEANEANQRQLEQKVKDEGVESLYEQLQKVDPEYAQKMDGMNTQRIIRALDVWMQTGQPFSSFHSRNKLTEPPPDTLVFGLKRNRRQLYDRINERVDRMFDHGLLDEVEKLLEMGYTTEDQGMNTVGYREAVAFLTGEISEDQMRRDIKTRTRRYAKRQLTWFRRWPFIKWIDAEKHSTGEIVKNIRAQLAAIANNN